MLSPFVGNSVSTIGKRTTYTLFGGYNSLKCLYLKCIDCVLNFSLLLGITDMDVETVFPENGRFRLALDKLAVGGAERTQWGCASQAGLCNQKNFFEMG